MKEVYTITIYEKKPRNAAEKALLERIMLYDKTFFVSKEEVNNFFDWINDISAQINKEKRSRVYPSISNNSNSEERYIAYVTLWDGCYLTVRRYVLATAVHIENKLF